MVGIRKNDVFLPFFGLPMRKTHILKIDKQTEHFRVILYAVEEMRQNFTKKEMVL